MRIATLNVRHDADRWPERLPVVVNTLRESAADVIALQEVALRVDQADAIAHGLNAHLPAQAPPYRVLVQPKQGFRPREGIAVLTRLPIRAHERLALDGARRVAQRVRVDAGGWTLDVVNAHLHHLPRDSEAVRLAQMRAILHWMERQPFPAGGWVLLGDMNAKPGSVTIQAAQERLISAYDAVHGGPPSQTFPTPLPPHHAHPPVTIDFIFCDPDGITAADAWLIGDTPHPDDAALYASDHYGLAAVLEPRPR